MELIIEWEGISGVVKIILLFSIFFFVGFLTGRKTKK